MLNKLILRAFLSITLAISFAGVANATLITQNILSDTDEVLGFIAINTDTAEDVGNGLSSVFVWEEFTFRGVDMAPPAIADGYQFFAEYNTDNLFEGIQFLYAEVDDVFGNFALQLEIFDGVSSIDIFDLSTQQVTFSNENGSIGSVSVPEPSILLIFFTALVAFASRRKANK